MARTAIKKFKRIVRRDKRPFWFRGLRHNGLWDVCTAAGYYVKKGLTRREAASILLEEWDRRGRTIRFI